jgi:hypothetical protein
MRPSRLLAQQPGSWLIRGAPGQFRPHLTQSPIHFARCLVVDRWCAPSVAKPDHQTGRHRSRRVCGGHSQGEVVDTSIGAMIPGVKHAAPCSRSV